MGRTRGVWASGKERMRLEATYRGIRAFMRGDCPAAAPFFGFHGCENPLGMHTYSHIYETRHGMRAHDTHRPTWAQVEAFLPTSNEGFIEATVSGKRLRLQTHLLVESTPYHELFEDELIIEVAQMVYYNHQLLDAVIKPYGGRINLSTAGGRVVISTGGFVEIQPGGFAYVLMDETDCGEVAQMDEEGDPVAFVVGVGPGAAIGRTGSNSTLCGSCQVMYDKTTDPDPAVSRWAHDAYYGGGYHCPAPVGGCVNNPKRREHKATFLGRRVSSWTVECSCGWRTSRDTRYKLGRAFGKHKRGELQ